MPVSDFVEFENVKDVNNLDLEFSINDKVI